MKGRCAAGYLRRNAARQRSWLAFCAAVFMCTACAASARQPLSAIDWLSQSVSRQGASGGAYGGVNEPPISSGALPGRITVTSIDGPLMDALGLLPSSRSGLPYHLWGSASSIELAREIKAEMVETLPSIQALLQTLLLAELAPPVDATGRGELFLARIDKLLDLGALDQALALMELVEQPQAEVFRRWFDAALLIGQEDRACTRMLATPEIAPTFPARIFCLARSGDWNAAALSLRTGEALGYIEADMAELLARFLDPELFEGEPDLPLPARPSPLVFRLMEAIGQPLQTTTLPLAFAQADLRSNAGWKARIEAGERLARTGVIGENQLFGLYTERKAAASGGVWERVKAVQELEKALAAGDPGQVAPAIQAAWQMMTAVELEVPFANRYASSLDDLPLQGPAADLSFRIGLLSDAYEDVAETRRALDSDEDFLIGVARGRIIGQTPPDQLGLAIKLAFTGGTLQSPEAARFLDQGRIGEAVLLAIHDITEGARGDLRRVTGGLQTLRRVGLETTARRAALELLLLERRG
ncbi:MAG: hypothetical protein KDE11_03445 [Rhodobacteraceae bacterium]|nr:hypothetical protein [Paracoccaceae bacterium]